MGQWEGSISKDILFSVRCKPFNDDQRKQESVDDALKSTPIKFYKQKSTNRIKWNR